MGGNQMIVIDVGQSGSRALFGDQLFTLDRGKLEGEAVVDTLHAIAQLLPNLKSDLTVLSLTGLYGDVGSVDPYLTFASKHFSSNKCLVMDDGLASYFSSLGTSDGVSLTLGGGVVAIGGKSGKYSHADGLGSTFGDEGSGYWLGSRALSKALATRDGREEYFELAEIFKDEILRFDGLEVKNSREAFSLAIECAKKLLETADTKLPIALEIRGEGAKKLARTVLAAWKKVDGHFEEPLTIAVSGGLSKSQSYVEAIAAEIEKSIAALSVLASKGDNLRGATLIAETIEGDLPPVMKWASL
jgi:N-acetylglucosamine kinase-like BadF-type ATPase